LRHSISSIFITLFNPKRVSFDAGRFVISSTLSFTFCSFLFLVSLPHPVEFLFSEFDHRFLALFSPPFPRTP